MNFYDKALAEIALEEDTSGVGAVETEHVFYVFINNFDQLKSATSKIHQEQWEVKLPRTEKNATSGSLRVRKVVEEGQPVQYCLTTKLLLNEDGDKDEVTTETSADMFTHLAFLSPGGMIKDRYTFPIEGSELVWEVDMFLKPDGTYHNWAKIDLEVKDRNEPIPEQFPVQFSQIIKGGYQQQSEAEAKKISELYSNFFLTPNKYRHVEALSDD